MVFLCSTSLFVFAVVFSIKSAVSTFSSQTSKKPFSQNVREWFEATKRKVRHFRLTILNSSFRFSRYVFVAELRLMFSLMDRVDQGIVPMKNDLETHIKSQGLADMTAAAGTITTVRQKVIVRVECSLRVVVVVVFRIRSSMLRNFSNFSIDSVF